MRLGFRGKLFAGFVLVITAVVLASGVFLEVELRSWYEAHTEAELLRLAGTARTALELSPGSLDIENVDPLADRLGTSTSARITIIAADGTVLGDSTLSADEVRALENHRQRPEVQEALASGKGMARRYSSTKRTDMLYLALPFQRPDGAGLVRAALPLDEIDAMVARLRLLVLVAALVAVGAAVLFGGLASHFFTRTLRRLVEKAKHLAEGSDRHILLDSKDELGGLVGSLNQLAGDLSKVVTDLGAERDRFANVLEGMEEAVLAVDADLRVTLVNTSAAVLLEFAHTPVGMSLLEVVRIPALQELVKKALTGEPATGEFHLPSIIPRQLLAHARPLLVTGGAVVVMHDVTELHRLEAVRRDFVANASHELRTPASVIAANAETLLGGALEDRAHAREFVEAIQRNADRLSRLVADLLDISRLEAGRYAMELRSVGVAAAAQRVVDTFRGMAQEKHQEIRLEIDGTLQALADSKGLEQALSNLVDNAVKYTPEGGHLAIRARTGSGRVRLEVVDDGPGIEPRHRQRIFERFYRIDPGRSRDLGGTGLGLAIVKHLVEAMDGKVGMEPNSPRGSIFWVSLPESVSG